jgi:hypothetical protein
VKGKHSLLGTWKRAMLVVVPLLALLVGLQLTSTAHAAMVINVSVPTERQVFVPCANGGVGEVIVISGELHALISVTLDANGGVHEHILFNPQGVDGVGLTTGLKYQRVGVAEEDINGTVGSTDTFVEVFDMIGQGPGNNFKLHVTSHITVNADGSLTASVANIFSTCK